MAWNRDEQADALKRYAEATGMTVFTGVPVTAPGWQGWSERAATRLATVAVAHAGGLGGRVESFPGDDEFADALIGVTAVRPIVAVGYADRPVYGHLVTRQAFVARTWTPTCPVQPVALVARGKEGTNVRNAYFAAGFEIHVVGDEPPPKRGGEGTSRASNDPWGNPKTFEDRLLHALWTARRGSGWWAAEVPVGFGTRPNGGSARRIDAVVVHGARRRHSAANRDHDELAAAVRDGHVELIEAKRHLSANLIGQLLCGAAMFNESYGGEPLVTLTACVPATGDEALRWFCGRVAIDIAVVEPARLATDGTDGVLTGSPPPPAR